MSPSGGNEAVTAEIVALLDGSTSTCQLLAEQDEGPYRRGDQPRRRDVTEGRAGSPLRLGLRFRTTAGDEIAGADVEIWHCDAGGRYSGYPPNDPEVTIGDYLPAESFLRGLQTTDDGGHVEFATIYPGWYPGRTVHIHLMVHTAARTYTSQLYFPEDLTAEVFAREPYRSHGLPDTTHASDGIFSTGGRPAVLDVGADGAGHTGLICLVLPAQGAA